MTVEVSDLPFETIENIAERLRGAEQRLGQAQRNNDAIPEQWQVRLTYLVDHYMHDDLSWDPWTTGMMEDGGDDHVSRR